MPNKTGTRVVEIEATVHPAESLFFRVSAGTAEADGKTWELSVNAAGHQPIVRLPDGRWVTFTWTALVSAAEAAGRDER